MKKLLITLSLSTALLSVPFVFPMTSHAAYPETAVTLTANSSDSQSVYALRILSLVNDIRSRENLPPLSMNDSLNEAAQLRAMELQQSLSHIRPDGRRFSTVLTSLGITFQTAGENIACGHTSPEEVVEAWMASPGHKANLLNESYTTIGICHYKSESGINYWIQEFIG